MDSAKAYDFRRKLDARIESLRQVRMSWWLHWQQLAEYILPRRYVWLATPNQLNRGAPLNQKILNNTATIAARNMAAGILSGTTSQVRPWLRLVAPPDLMRDHDVKVYCEEITRRVLRIMAVSNYYTSKGVQALDLSVFGTAPLLIYEDRENVIRCFNPVAGEYFAWSGPNFDVQGLAREFVMTSSQIVDEFGQENASLSVRAAYDNAGMGGRDQEFVIRHIVEPNPNYVREYADVPPDEMGLPRHFKYREFYWDPSTSTDRMLAVRGYHECPFSCVRWDVLGNEPYGRSPAMDALGDIKQLQLEEIRKAQGIEKQVNPPMVADVSMRNEPASLLPGAITYAKLSDGGVGFRPAIDPRIPLADLTNDIAACSARIKDAFYNDLFLMISQLEGDRRTATEIDARREEKLNMVGPAIDRIHREGLAKDIQRILGIAARRGLLPPPPDSMRDTPLRIEYISLLADLQRASVMSGIERIWALGGNIGAAKQDVLDNLDEDATIEEAAELLRVPPRLLRDKRAVMAMRQARAEQQQQQAMLENAGSAVEAGKVLSETDVGAGQNALQLMLGGGQL